MISFKSLAEILLIVICIVVVLHVATTFIDVRNRVKVLETNLEERRGDVIGIPTLDPTLDSTPDSNYIRYRSIKGESTQ